jgi:hypothetical protein
MTTKQNNEDSREQLLERLQTANKLIDELESELEQLRIASRRASA